MTRLALLACPGVSRPRNSVVLVVPGGRVTVKGTCCAYRPPYTSAFGPGATCTLVSTFAGVPALVFAVSVTRRRPSPLGTVATPTGGRGAQGAGTGVAVGVLVGGSV